MISRGGDNNQMSICSHEEADTRIVVHLLHALEQGMKNIKVCTVDTDIVTILVGMYILQLSHALSSFRPVGMGKRFRFYSINVICSSLVEAKSRALPVFHAITGTVSAFKGKGK